MYGIVFVDFIVYEDVFGILCNDCKDWFLYCVFGVVWIGDVIDF